MDGSKSSLQAKSVRIALVGGMAEREGFEPSVEALVPYNGLANRRFRPLSHLSERLFILRCELLPGQVGFLLARYLGNRLESDDKADCRDWRAAGLDVAASNWLIKPIRWLISVADQSSVGAVLPKSRFPY
jgi:hypothetical protein